MAVFVLSYGPATDIALARSHFPAHRIRLDEFHARGDLHLVGTFGDDEGGAMAVFRTREAAEEFASDDPFVTAGVVGSWRIRPWNESLGTW